MKNTHNWRILIGCCHLTLSRKCEQLFCRDSNSLDNEAICKCSAERVEQMERMERVEHPTADKILSVLNVTKHEYLTPISIW